MAFSGSFSQSNQGRSGDESSSHGSHSHAAVVYMTVVSLSNIDINYYVGIRVCVKISQKELPQKAGQDVVQSYLLRWMSFGQHRTSQPCWSDREMGVATPCTKCSWLAVLLHMRGRNFSNTVSLHGKLFLFILPTSDRHVWFVWSMVRP